MNELLPHPMLCWYATSGAGGLRSGNQLIPGNAKQYSDMKFLNIYFPIPVAMFSVMFHRLMWINFFYYTLDIRFYLSQSVNKTSYFSNFADLRQLQIPNAQNEILWNFTCAYQDTS